MNLNLYKNTAPCFLSEGKRDREAKGALLRPRSGLGVELVVLAVDVKKPQTIVAAAYENDRLFPLVRIQLYFQVAGHFRAASCRRRTCSSWFLPAARAATTVRARCSTASCAPWAAPQTRAASVDRQSVSGTAFNRCIRLDLTCVNSQLMQTERKTTRKKTKARFHSPADTDHFTFAEV